MKRSKLWLFLGIVIGIIFLVDWQLGLGSLTFGTMGSSFLLGWLSGGFITAYWYENRPAGDLTSDKNLGPRKGAFRSLGAGFIRLCPVWIMFVVFSTHDHMRDFPPAVQVLIVLGVVALSAAFMKQLLGHSEAYVDRDTQHP